MTCIANILVLALKLVGVCLSKAKQSIYDQLTKFETKTANFKLCQKGRGDIFNID